MAGFRPQAASFSAAIDHVAQAQAVKQRELDEILIRTQSNPPTEVVTTFAYDGDGGRVIKKVSELGVVSVTVYIGQHYVCQGPNAQNLGCAKLIFANGQRIAMVEVLPGGGNGAVTYFHPDHLGSTSVVTEVDNGQFQVEQELAYYPFGATRVNTTSNNVDVAYKYTGQELDSSTDLYFYQARYYDANLGRFIQPDPIVSDPNDPQAFNRYSYVVNNPVLYIDPTGFRAELTDRELDEIVAVTLRPSVLFIKSPTSGPLKPNFAGDSTGVPNNSGFQIIPLSAVSSFSITNANAECLTPGNNCYGAHLNTTWHLTFEREGTGNVGTNSGKYDPYIFDLLVRLACDCGPFDAELSRDIDPSGTSNFQVPGVARNVRVTFGREDRFNLFINGRIGKRISQAHLSLNFNFGQTIGLPPIFPSPGRFLPPNVFYGPPIPRSLFEFPVTPPRRQVPF